MREEPEAFVSARHFAFGLGLMSFAGVLGDRTRDGVVQASVQRAEIIGADRRMKLDGQLGNRLADVTIIVHHL